MATPGDEETLRIDHVTPRAAYDEERSAFAMLTVRRRLPVA